MGTPPTGGPGGDEAALVRRCCAGERAAKRQLLQQLLPTIRGAVVSLLGPGADADDAAQQAAIDILRGLPSFGGHSPLRSWARTIAVRAGLKAARSRRRHVSVAELHGESTPGVGFGERESALAERLPRSLDAYLAVLPAVQREALVLRHALGYTVAEVAALVGVSENTVKSRLLSARREVRRCIRRDEAIGLAPAMIPPKDAPSS